VREIKFLHLKKFIIIFNLFIVFKPVLPIVEYIVFYDYITTELCENKEAPELECNGACHLKKELSKVSDSENPFSTDKNNRPLIEFSHLFFEDVQLFNPELIRKLFTKEYSVYLNLYSHLTTNFIFQPPAKF
jgi:hypothetical protein